MLETRQRLLVHLLLLLTVSMILDADYGGMTAAQTCQTVPFAGWYGIGNSWEQMFTTSSATAWHARTGFGFAAIGGRLAVFGGEDISRTTLYNDVHSSFDGKNWVPHSSPSAWSPRANFLHLVHNGYIYLWSGRGCGGYCKDIFRAPVPAEGAVLNFEKLGDLPRGGRMNGLGVSLQGRLYDIGGKDNSGSFTDIYMHREGDDWNTWHQVTVSEADCAQTANCAPDCKCFWTENYIGGWLIGGTNDDEYRVVGTTHLDAIYIFGGKTRDPDGSNTKVLKLTCSDVGLCLKMDLRKLGSVGLKVYRAYAFSFLGTLWFATGTNDNNEGTNGLFYNQNANNQWGEQGKDDIGNSGSANFFSGRLQRGTLFRNRICLLLGETLEQTNRWKVLCSVKPRFPAPCIGYSSENVGTTAADVLLSDPASLNFVHAALPTQVAYTVKYYAGVWDPDKFSDYVSDKWITLNLMGCSHQFTYQQKRTDSPVVYVRVTLTFDDSQPYQDTSKTEAWSIKIRLTPPTEVSRVSKSVTGSQPLKHIKISCRDDECGQAAPCSVAHRRDLTQNTLKVCASPCEVQIQDQYVPDQLFDVQVQCQKVNSEIWLPSTFMTFFAKEGFNLTTPVPNSYLSTSPPKQIFTTSPPKPIVTTPAPRMSLNITEWRLCNEQPFQNCLSPASVASTYMSTQLMIRGKNLDLVQKVLIGKRTLVGCSSYPSDTYSCLVPPGLGVEDLTVTWTSTQGLQKWVVLKAIRYPEPKVLDIDAGLSDTAGGGVVTIKGTSFGGGEGVFGGFSETTASPWNSHGFRAAASIGVTSVASVRWLSDSTLTLCTSRGVGLNLKILLSIHGTAIEPLRTLSYEAPQLMSVHPSIGPAEGGIQVTFSGRYFGVSEHLSTITKMHESNCSQTKWVSDSSMICTTPSGQLGAKVPATAVVGDQYGIKKGSYQYTSASGNVVLVLSQSPDELKASANDAYGGFSSRLDGFCAWLKATFVLEELSQIYIGDVQTYMLEREREQYSEAEEVGEGERDSHAGAAGAYYDDKHAQLPATHAQKRLLLSIGGFTGGAEGAARKGRHRWEPLRGGKRGRVTSYTVYPAERKRVGNGAPGVRQSSKTKLTLRFFESPKNPKKTWDIMLENLEFLAKSEKGFEGAGVGVICVKFPRGNVIELSSPKTINATVSGSSTTSSQTGNVMTEVVSAVVVVVMVMVHYRNKVCKFLYLISHIA